MKISLEWLSDFVDISDIAPEIIADRLTMATAEVEGFERIERCVEGVVIAEVVSVEPLTADAEGGTKLVLATVNTGTGTRVTVCGARNVRVGLKAPFAAAGCRLADAVEIHVSEVAGKKSEGVLCSAKELGFGEFHEGVLECPSWLEAGAGLSQYVKAHDVLVEIDNKSLTNRPDLLGHYGFAREVAAIFSRPLRELTQVNLSRFDRLPTVPIALDDPEACPCYTCLEFEVDALAAAPLFIQARLHALGQRSFGLMVDLSNYVMLETGQPTHAFDAELVKSIRVAPLGQEKGTFQTLDGVWRKLRSSDLMIWNEERPVALAGIMGGLESEVTGSTSRVLLESANFKGSRVRRTSTHLGLRTEASQRFEKNQPPANTSVAVGRMLHILEENQVAYRPTSRFSVAGELQDAFRPLHLSVGAVKRAAGFPIEDELVVSILSSLGFQAEIDAGGKLRLGVPPFRSEQDISIEPDIIEEVLRIYGYDNVPPELPTAHLKPVHIDDLLRREHKAQRMLAVGYGFAEVHTYIWTDDLWLKKLGFEPGPTLVLKNPSAEGKRQLRTTLMPNLLALIDQNRSQYRRAKFFEVGHVFKTSDGESCEERTHLAGASFIASAEEDLESHYLSVKSAVEDVARVVGCGELFFEKSDAGQAPWMTGGNWVSVVLNGESIGEIGFLSGHALEICAPGGQVVWFELNLAKMAGHIFAQATYQPPPVYPLSWQDFSVLWSLEKGYTELRRVLDEFSHPLIKRVDFRGVFKEPSSKHGSYTFRFRLGAPDRTLTSEDLEQFHAGLLNYLSERGIQLK